jgi:hypothetical protein
MIMQLFSILAPVFFGAAFGYGWAKLDKPFDAEFVTSLVFNLGTPLLVFSTLTRLDTDPLAFADIALVIVVAILKIAQLDLQTYLATVMIPNTGNVGLPLCFLAFGDKGLAFAIIVYTIVSLTQFTVGLSIASGTFSLRELSRNPLVYAVLAALLVMITEYELPAWIANTTRIYGQFAIPLMLIMLGVSLAKLRITSLPRNIALSFVRFSMGLGVGLFVSHLFGLEGVVRGVVVLECAMPAAVFNYMLAMRYNTNPDEVAGLVVTSTLFSFATLPFLLAFVLKL